MKPEVFKVKTLTTLKNIIRTWRLRRKYRLRMQEFYDAARKNG